MHVKPPHLKGDSQTILRAKPQGLEVMIFSNFSPTVVRSPMIHEYEKMFKISIRNMGKENIEICQITLKLIFRCNPLSRSGYEVCPIAPQHV